jgi:D-alanyl-D-alanine endopeptidase (penicillin-binding protein 7)
MCRIISLLVLFALLHPEAAISAPVKSLPITAVSWLVADDRGQIIQGSNTALSRSIASITKIMTAMVVLDSKQNLEEMLGSHTRGELIQLAMIRSDNAAAQDLCVYYPGGVPDCVKAMNHRARDLGMTNTKFVDPTGLGIMNISTSEDLVKMVVAAQHYPELVQASTTPVLKSRSRRQRQDLYNTNPLVATRPDVVISKTGYIRAAGGCVVMMINSVPRPKVIVVLGSQTTLTRIPEADFLASLN